MTDWEHRCVLCAARGRTRRLESGHCCVDCASWLTTQVADIARLAADAAAWVAPGSSTGGGGHSVPSSRPPLNVEALQPELTHIGPPPAPTVLEVLESWERMVRDMRGMAPYGEASAARSRAITAREGTLDGLNARSASNDTGVTLIGSVAFLGRQVPWMTTTDFPLEDFADEIRACVRVLRRFDLNAEDMGTMVKCPTLHEDEGECGYRLYYRDFDEHVTCRRCGVSRDASTLVAVAMSDGRDVWLDPEAAAKWLGVSEGHLRRMARRGDLQRDHGRYLVRDAMGVTA